MDFASWYKMNREIRIRLIFFFKESTKLVCLVMHIVWLITDEWSRIAR